VSLSVTSAVIAGVKEGNSERARERFAHFTLKGVITTSN
jgi:hypothetical protein